MDDSIIFEELPAFGVLTLTYISFTGSVQTVKLHLPPSIPN